MDPSDRGNKFNRAAEMPRELIDHLIRYLVTQSLRSGDRGFLTLRLPTHDNGS